MYVRLLRAAVTLSLIGATLGTIAAPAAALSNYTVTTTDDVVGTDGLFSLREAMDAANQDNDDSSITLGAGLTYFLDICEVKAPYKSGGGSVVAPEDDDANLDGDLDHTEDWDLTIYGNGSTIRQTCDYDRVIHSLDTGVLLTIDDTIIRNGSEAPEDGDNIRSHGSLTLQDDTLVTAGTYYVGDLGGYAVQVGDGSNIPGLVFTIDNASISGNGETAARLDYGTLMADGATVSNNDGSGFVPSFAQTNISDSTITNNSGTGVNGFDNPTTIEGSTISDNGNGVATSGNTPGASPLSIDDSTIENNARGGVSCSFCASVTVDDSSISNNGSSDGPLGSFGGITMLTYDANDGMSITDSTLAGNLSPNDGGAIRARFDDQGGGGPGAAPVVLIDNTDFLGNRSGILSDGGAVYVEDGSVVVQNGSTFDSNEARPSPTMTGGDGGAIMAVDAESLTITDSSFVINTAHGDGGAIMARNSETALIERSHFSDNRALSAYGGAINFSNIVDIEIRDTTMIDNSARLTGGGIRFTADDDLDYDVSFDGTTVSHNSATHGLAGGGGIAASGDRLDLGMTNSTVTDNVSFGHGGGLAILGNGDVELWHVTMAANQASDRKAANLYHQNGRLTSYATFIGIGVGTGPDCYTYSGAVSSLGYNLSGDSSCGFSHWSDDTGVVGVGLGSLAENGGPTPTRKPSKTSPLVNVIPEINCGSAVDQRNVARPQGTQCDVGAVEVPGFGSGPGGFTPTPPPPRKPGLTTDPGTGAPVDPGRNVGIVTPGKTTTAKKAG